MVAVLPEPPLLVPALAGGRDRDRRAARGLPRRGRPAGRGRTALDRGRLRPGGPAHGGREARGSFVGFGVDLVVGLDTAARPPRSTRGWRCRCSSPVGRRVAPAPRSGSGASSSPSTTARRPAPRSAPRWPRSAPPIRPRSACSSLGDGAATHTERAPGHLDERARRRSTRRWRARSATPTAPRSPGWTPSSPPSCSSPAGRRGRCWPRRPRARRGAVSCCTRRRRSAWRTTWRSGRRERA